MCTPKELLKVHPVTEVDGVLSYSERTMRVIAQAILPGVSTIEPRSVFTRKFMQGLEPWVNTHPKDGKMTKRIAAYLHDGYNHDINQRLISGIGSLLSAEAPSGKFYYDVTNDLSWQPGDYGDADACFLISRRSVLDSMMDANGFAMRYHKDAAGSKGTGRAWLMPGPDGLPIIFNAYGPNLDQFVARLQLITPGVPVSRILLKNRGSTDGTLYINSGVGVLIGSDEPDFDMEYDLEVDTSSLQQRFRCHHCGGRYSTRERHAAQIPSSNGDGFSNVNICSACANDFYEYDPVFSYYFTKGSLAEVLMIGDYYTGPHGYTVADLVLKRTHPEYAVRATTKCGGCGNFNPYPYPTVTISDGEGTPTRRVCLHCAKDYQYSCMNCGVYTKTKGHPCGNCGRNRYTSRH